MKRVLTALACALPLLGAAADRPAEAAKPDLFKIGAILAMTGGGNYYGTVMSRGAQLAIDEINAKGGVDGTKLELVIEDHKSGNAQAAVAAMNRLINIHNVQAVESSYSPPTLAIAPIADEKKIFIINGGGVSAQMVGASKYLVHNRSLASDLARGIINRAHERGFKKMAIVAWKTDAGESVRDIAKEIWTKLGGTVVAEETVVPGSANIDTQMAKLRTSNPDFILTAVFRPEVGTVLKRAREFGIKVPMMGIEYTPDDAKVAGEAAAGFEFTNDYFQPTADNPKAEAFYNAYKSKFDQEPDFYAANYYEATYVIAELLRRAYAAGNDTPNGEDLMNMLKKDPHFDSIYGGEMLFQENGVAAKRVGLFEVQKDGEKKFVKFIETAAPAAK